MELRLFEITARGPRHYREERVPDGGNRGDGKPVTGDRFVRGERGEWREQFAVTTECYAAKGSALEGSFRSQIWLTPDELPKLKHLALQPVVTEVKTPAYEEPAEDALAGDTSTGGIPVVPDDWEELPDDAKKELASRIAGEPVGSKAKAERIIKYFLKGE